ncbi:MAG: hypothetical protein JJU22_03990 [Gammaproteobacteria bacterium]|nr:hypothetical protein [Gammaproteobacteria bacterium]
MKVPDDIADLLDGHELEARLEHLRAAAESGHHTSVAATIRELIIAPISEWDDRHSSSTTEAMLSLDLEARWLASKLDEGPVVESRWRALERCWRELVASVERDALNVMTYTQSERRRVGTEARQRRDDGEVNSARDNHISATYLEQIEGDPSKTPGAVRALAKQHGLSEKRIREILKQIGVFRPARKPRAR